MKCLKGLTCTALAAAFLIPMTQAYAKKPGATTIRPIEDFVERQGTYCLDIDFNGAYVDEIVDGNFVGDCPTGAPPLIFVPPVANFIGSFDPDNGRLASVDYAGLANYWAGGAFGTTFSGTVIERPLADGRALVEVLLRTKNALTWVVDGNIHPDLGFNGPLLFGNRAPEVVGGAEPALGRSHIKYEFINTAPGADLPDLIQLFISPEEGQELLSSRSNDQATGPLSSLFGVPDGTPGRSHGVQVGLLSNPNCGADSPSAVADCFPAEKIKLQVIGQ